MLLSSHEFLFESSIFPPETDSPHSPLPSSQKFLPRFFLPLGRSKRREKKKKKKRADVLRVFPVREERGRRISVPGLFARTFSSVARPPERRRSQKREPWLAATAISTCAVVNVSRAPGLLPFSPAFLSPPPPPSFSPRTCRAEKLSSLSLSLSFCRRRCCCFCLIEPVAVSCCRR